MLALIGGRMGETFGSHEAGLVLAVTGGVVLLGSHLLSLRRCREACAAEAAAA